ncbi:Af4/Fmr2 Family Member 3 [Manis pentadactyla]|nr:Af4/Fmr2 Family Member 3 [Manis pentadactyla]
MFPFEKQCPCRACPKNSVFQEAYTELEGRKSWQPQKRLELDLRRHLEPGGVPSSEATAFTNMPFSGAQLPLTWDTPTPFNGYLELQFKELCFDPYRSINKETAEPDSSSRKIRQILKCQQHSSMTSIKGVTLKINILQVFRSERGEHSDASSHLAGVGPLLAADMPFGKP